jgi:hypothetical protein
VPEHSRDWASTTRLKSAQMIHPAVKTRRLTWVGKSSSFQQDIIKGTLSLHEILNSSDPTILDTAAQASVCEFKELFRLFRTRRNVYRLCCLFVSLSRASFWKVLKYLRCPEVSVSPRISVLDKNIFGPRGKLTAVSPNSFMITAIRYPCLSVNTRL